MIYILSFRDPGRKRGGPVTKGSLKTLSGGLTGLDAQASLMTKEKITFLIHGYNVNLKKGRESLTRLARHLEASLGGAIVAVLWPGDHFIRALSYPFEGRDADESADNMITYLIEMVKIKKTVPLSFVTHSMGGRVGLEAIEGLAREGYTIGQVCLMAAAVDDFSLADLREYRAGVGDCDRVAVLYSGKDTVLKYAYPAGDLLQAFLFSRDEAGFALGFNGPCPSKRGEAVPDNVIDKEIPTEKEARHSHYVPGFLPGQTPTTQKHENQLSATNYARAVLLEEPDPQYP